VSLMAAGGALLAAIAGFLPWYTAGGFKVDGWDIWFWALVTDDPSTAGPKAGLVMLLSLPAVAAAVVRLPAWALGLCCLPALSGAGFGVLRWLTADDPKPDLGIGLLLGLVAGALIASAAFVDAFGSSASRR